MRDFESSDGMVKQAYLLAREAHRGQVDKAGQDYILHPMSVASNVGDDEVCITTALLHDVVEDTNVTMEDLEEQFPKEVTDALRCLTHQKGMSYFDYLARIYKNEIATKVKLADLTHNMDISRLKEVTNKDRKRVRKYKNAYAYLIAG